MVFARLYSLKNPLSALIHTNCGREIPEVCFIHLVRKAPNRILLTKYGRKIFSSLRLNPARAPTDPRICAPGLHHQPDRNRMLGRAQQEETVHLGLVVLL